MLKFSGVEGSHSLGIPLTDMWTGEGVKLEGSVFPFPLRNFENDNVARKTKNVATKWTYIPSLAKLFSF